MTAPEVTLVIPVWNRRELLEDLFRALAGQSFRSFQVVVVDNGSTDGSPEWAQQNGARVIRMGSNAGFCRAVNRGIGNSRSPWIGIVNNDVRPAPQWLERLLQAAASGAWFATGKILQAGSGGGIDGTFDALCRGGCAWRVGSGRPDGPLFSEPRTISMAPATAALFRRELFARVGLFDDRFESYLEDVDFGLRCALQNLSGVYVPDALAWHIGSATLGRWHSRTVRLIARNQALLVRKHYPPGLLLRWAWPILVSQALWGMLALRHGTGRAFLAGKIEALRCGTSIARRADATALDTVIRASEDHILNVQRAAGFDWYWRAYFLLTGRAA
jgi:GT2 family glycosyltransferase